MIHAPRTGRLFACFVSLAFLLQSALAAQSEVGLRLQIVQGDGASNAVDRTPEKPFTVRVTDRNKRPIPGATVTFTAPDNGASGDFDGEKTIRVITNENGLATASNYRPNDIEGRYPVLVQAEYMGEIATGIMVQTNVAPKKSHGKLIAIVAIAGAVGAAFAARSSGGGSSSNSPGTTPTPTPTVPSITFGSSSVSGTK